MMGTDFLREHDIAFTGSFEEEVVSAEGIRLMTCDKRIYANYNEITSMLGQNHKVFVERMVEAMQCGIYTPVKGYESDKVALFQKLLRLTNNDFPKIFLSTSGSEAIEWAVRIARHYTGRNEVIAYSGSLHGRTYMAACLSGIDRRKKGLGVQAPGIIHIPYPTCQRCYLNLDSATCGSACANDIDRQLDYQASELPAAILIEPFTGSTGMVTPPKGYLKKLRTWADRHDVLLIFDEIQTAFGKTGDMFMYQREGVTPDMLVLGKGLGNGFHIAALMTKTHIMDQFNGTVLAGGTGSNPITIAAANAVIDILESEQWLEHVKKIEAYLVPEFERWCHMYDVVDNFRGMGAVYGIEFVTSDGSRKPNAALTDIIVKGAKEKGLLLGRSGNILFFRPPICVTEGEARHFIEVVEGIFASWQ
ncbi:aminotransferase class III-fold pyridoxal phosphate-dependent enzyme [Fusibacter paucivorans]|uniref:Aminotransferase class III-fold pyridoxal phosphate-dependent enzyme n=1 Tax=Fusibacter paucivorans TaxID=76009 RepID=A0ABS5PRD7_9FIRM|nr:aminotransferase class III-fold pyridoxal phosphate-dependent enzyme [Fusibacter paucivorans]MBS7527636.1 aminotransferase class III-fold pyridoxal phosphate-dependent enzyme [Fusibacter paucivorans]